MVDRGRVYEPGPGIGPEGHQLNDQMFALLGASMTPADLLDVSGEYDYDSLQVEESDARTRCSRAVHSVSTSL